jgi:chlorophyllase
MEGVKGIWFRFPIGLLLSLLLLLSHAEEITELEAQSIEVFKEGPYSVGRLDIPPWGEDPLKPLLVAVPTAKGVYPVVMFLHAYFPVKNYFYWQMLEHVASHGYIVVAPQMYDITGWNTTDEMLDVASIRSWLPEGLTNFFPPDLAEVKPDFQRVAIAGHSRGGKVAFGAAMGLFSPPSFSALAALDPVDGATGHPTSPPLLTNSQNSLNLKVPTLVVGTGLGPAEHWMFPTCAPEGLDHVEFFRETPGSAYHFVAVDQGHQDILNDDVDFLACFLCKCKAPLAPMRRFGAGILVAFLDATVGGNGAGALNDVIRNPHLAPVRLEKPEFKPPVGSETGPNRVMSG